MSRRTDRYHQDEDLNIFQAFTDLMSNAFMIVSFLLLISLLQSMLMAKKLKSTESNLISMTNKLKFVESQSISMAKKNMSAEPIIIDEKSGEFKFPSGSADLTPELLKHIQTNVIPAIQNATRQGNIDFIQVIGHTDSQGISNFSNLDGKLTSAAIGKEKINALKAGSNTDLGLMRAVAVVQFLSTKKLGKVKFRAYSAGQLYMPSGELAKIDRGADDTRRRIEIRFIPYGQKK
jgi:outer membrane protein OmpA-like peptidoglycan-associated protein